MAQEFPPLGRFELVKQLSAGGMGEIYLARCRGAYQFEKLFILKLMKPEFAADSAELQRFAREARVAAQLNHRNIVQVFDFGSERGRYYIAMEYVDGFNLTRFTSGLLDKGLLLPYPLCAYVVAEVAHALHYMHTRRNPDGTLMHLVHRDVSPENVLISRQGEVKLTDFGLVKYSGAERLTRTGKVRGKLSYMAPERATGQEDTPASDQFSLGMVLHELLTGKRYFPADMERQDVQQQLLYDGIEPPARFDKEVPKVLDEVVRRATALDAKERFTSLYEMERLLRRYLIAALAELSSALGPEEELSQLVRSLRLEGELRAADRNFALPDVAGPLCRRLTAAAGDPAAANAPATGAPGAAPDAAPGGQAENGSFVGRLIDALNHSLRHSLKGHSLSGRRASVTK